MKISKFDFILSVNQQSVISNSSCKTRLLQCENVNIHVVKGRSIIWLG